jgi:hypothetical protein
MQAGCRVACVLPALPVCAITTTAPDGSRTITDAASEERTTRLTVHEDVVCS